MGECDKILVSQLGAGFSFGRGVLVERPIQTGNSHPTLEVYPIPILPLTTLGLLATFSTSTLAALPAFQPFMNEVKEEREIIVSPRDVRSEDYQPISDSKNVARFIKDYFADIPLMAKIAYCESRNRQYNSRGEVLRGEKTPLDRGVMQINLHYHKETAEKMGFDLHNIDDNVAYARYLYEKQGAKPWMSSSKCWSKLASQELAKN